MHGKWRRVTWVQSGLELWGITIVVLLAFAISRRAPQAVRHIHGNTLHTLRRPLAFCLLSLAVLLATSGHDPLTFSRWSTASAAGRAAAHEPQAALVARQPGDHSIVGAPSITAQQIDAVLAFYDSPAQGMGRAFYDGGVRHGIDPAYALAFFVHESGAGSNPEWAGLKDDGTTTHNVGNILCAGYPTCYGRFRDYASWQEGIEDWYRLIAQEYVAERGLLTVEAILPIYAPAAENDVAGYVRAVELLVDKWRRGARP